MTEQQARNELPLIVRNEFDNLTPADKAAFLEEYERHRKSKGWSYVLWFVGWHIGYIEGRWGFNVLYFLAFGITLGIWWLIELFRVGTRLRNHRAEVAIQALRDVRAVSGLPEPQPVTA